MKLSELEIHSKHYSDWSYDSKTLEISKTFQFKGYLSNINFVNAVAFLAQKLNHHPDMHIGFNKCVIKITTHDVGGVSEKDFELAKKIDELIS